MATIKQLSEQYSFNVYSELFFTLQRYDQGLWKDDIEHAYQAGGYAVLEALYHVINRALNEVQEGKTDSAVTIINRILDEMHNLKEDKDE